MSKPRSTSLEDLSLDALRDLVVELLSRVSALEAENAALREENARLKGLKGRPKLKPSGMEKATNRAKGKGKPRKRAPRRSPVVNEEHSAAETTGDRDRPRS